MSDRTIDLWVSPTGDDAATGLLDAPLRSLERARDVLRERRTGPERPAATVHLMPGVYRLNRPLVFDARDGGAPPAPVKWQATKAGAARICGGRPLTEWYAEGRHWCCDVGDLIFGQLYVDGQRARRARTPVFRHHRWCDESRELAIPADHIGPWQNLTDAEIIVLEHWSDIRLKLAGFRVEGDLAYLRFHEQPGYLAFTRPFPKRKDGRSCWLENARELMREPGDWYLDRQAGVLHYMPPDRVDLDRHHAIAPRLESLIELRGTPDRPIENMTLHGLAFEHTAWHRPLDQGFINGQAGTVNLDADLDNNQWVDRQPAAVHAEHVRGLGVTECTFRRLGAAAIDLHRGVRHSRIQRCHVHDVAGNGVMVGVFSEPEVEMHIPYRPCDDRKVCRDNDIRDNTIERVGCDYPGSVGIAAGCPARLTIADNLLQDMPYTGISVGWGWTHCPNAMHDNRIMGNRIRRVMNMMYDGGAIYTLSRQPGTVIADNVIEDLYDCGLGVDGDKPARAIYLDEGSGGSRDEPFVVRGNRFRRCEYEEKIKTKSAGRYVVLEDNG